MPELANAFNIPNWISDSFVPHSPDLSQQHLSSLQQQWYDFTNGGHVYSPTTAPDFALSPETILSAPQSNGSDRHNSMKASGFTLSSQDMLSTHQPNSLAYEFYHDYLPIPPIVPSNAYHGAPSKPIDSNHDDYSYRDAREVPGDSGHRNICLPSKGQEPLPKSTGGIHKEA